MKLAVNSNDLGLPFTTRRLLERMLSPLCGLDRTLIFTMRSLLGPRFIVGGAELTGVHLLHNQAEPGSYHIGGAGVVMHEAMIRALGESAERYSQFVSVFGDRHPVTVATYDDMARSEHRVPREEALTFFSPEQYAAPGFRFQPFDRTKPMGWVQATSLIDGSAVWVPAQLVLLSYMSNHTPGEPWLLSAVTTGTAAHTRRDLALRNALLELVQVDAIMGHWYSSATAPQILLDERTKPLRRLIERHFVAPWPAIRFHWIGSPDLVGMNVACVIKGAPGQIPAGGVGVGADLRLGPAMYKALLEAVGVMLLVRLNLVNQAVGYAIGGNGHATDGIDPAEIFDLDTNVNYYAFPEHVAAIDEKFVTDRVVRASELPADSDDEIDRELARLIDGFRASRKELVYLDLTSDDLRQLGLVSVRAWSPDTLSLCLPSAPPTRHPRFEAYGGLSHLDPHPYP